MVAARASVVAGRPNAATALGTRALPRNWAAALAGRLMRN